MSAAAPSARWLPAYVGIGSNLDDPASQVQHAIGRCARLPATRLIARSHLYISKPLGPVSQSDFTNAAIGLLTQLSPEELLGELRAVEVLMGRATAHERWGPRRIDLDLLAVGQETRTTTALQLPHPGIAERDFVLYPLREIAPQLCIVGVGRVAELCERVANRGIEPVRRVEVAA